MVKSLYEEMQEVLKEKSSDFTKDVRFLGTMTTQEEDVTGSVDVTTDIFVIIDEMPDGSTIKKFYDSDNNFIAGCDKDGKIYPSAEFASEDLSFLGQLEELNKNEGLSLNEYDKELNDIAKFLGISKEEVLAMSEADLEQEINGEEEPKLDLEDNGVGANEPERKESNENALDNISSKQEIDLNVRVDEQHTLGDVLGVPAGSKLVAVYSDSIANNKNTTRFSFIIKSPDGSLAPAEMLNQVGGKTSDKTVYSTNRDGSEVEKQNVDSSYAIDSPIVENGILTARIGSMGYIELRLWSNG